MQVQINSDEMITYLAMGWKLSQITFNDERCWMTMEGSIKGKVLIDLGLTEDDITTRETIPGIRLTNRMLCLWYCVERYGLTRAETARLFNIDHTAVSNAHLKVSQLIKVGPVNLPKKIAVKGGRRPVRTAGEAVRGERDL